MSAAEQPPETPHVSRKVIHAARTLHGGPAGFTNVVTSKHDGEIQLDPHATGACVLRFAEDEAAALAETILGWLGLPIVLKGNPPDPAQVCLDCRRVRVAR